MLLKLIEFSQCLWGMMFLHVKLLSQKTQRRQVLIFKMAKKSTKKEKTFRIKRCPECKSDNVGVVVSQEKKGEWECRKCKWKGKDIKNDRLSEQEFMKYLDEKDKEVS